MEYNRIVNPLKNLEYQCITMIQNIYDNVINLFKNHYVEISPLGPGSVGFVIKTLKYKSFKYISVVVPIDIWSYTQEDLNSLSNNESIYVITYLHLRDIDMKIMTDKELGYDQDGQEFNDINSICQEIQRLVD